MKLEFSWQTILNPGLRLGITKQPNLLYKSELYNCTSYVISDADVFRRMNNRNEGLVKL